MGDGFRRVRNSKPSQSVGGVALVEGVYLYLTANIDTDRLTSHKIAGKLERIVVEIGTQITV